MVLGGWVFRLGGLLRHDDLCGYRGNARGSVRPLVMGIVVVHLMVVVWFRRMAKVVLVIGRVYVWDLGMRTRRRFGSGLVLIEVQHWQLCFEGLLDVVLCCGLSTSLK